MKLLKSFSDEGLEGGRKGREGGGGVGTGVRVKTRCGRAPENAT